MAALARLVIMGFAVLTVIYFSLWFWSRALRRERLETRWAEKGRIGDREAFVRRGLQRYDPSIRRKLLIGVYVVPTLIVAAIVYVTNYG